MSPCKTVGVPGWRILGVAVVLTGWLAGASAVRGADSMDRLRPPLAEIAREVAQVLKQQNQDTVALGHFTPPPSLPGGGGSLIRKLLRDELRKAGITVQVAAEMAITGEYFADEDRQAGSLALRIKGILRHSPRIGQSKVLHTFDKRLIDEAVLVTLLGINIQPPPRRGGNRNSAVRRAIDKPKVVVRGARVLAGPASPYALEVVVSPRYHVPYGPRTPTVKKGLAFVPIRRGEFYAVKLINNSPYEAAVELHIDGLSMFAFSDVKDRDDQPKYTRLILSPHSTYLVRGWHRTNKKSDMFQVTSYAKSAVAELRQTTAKVGTLTASFAVARRKVLKKALPRSYGGKADMAKGEQMGDGAQDNGDNATGRGGSVSSSYAEVERDVGPPAAYIALRYTKR